MTLLKREFDRGLAEFCRHLHCSTFHSMSSLDSTCLHLLLSKLTNPPMTGAAVTHFHLFMPSSTKQAVSSRNLTFPLGRNTGWVYERKTEQLDPFPSVPSTSHIATFLRLPLHSGIKQYLALGQNSWITDGLEGPGHSKLTCLVAESLLQLQPTSIVTRARMLYHHGRSDGPATGGATTGSDRTQRARLVRRFKMGCRAT